MAKLTVKINPLVEDTPPVVAEVPASVLPANAYKAHGPRGNRSFWSASYVVAESSTPVKPRFGSMDGPTILPVIEDLKDRNIGGAQELLDRINGRAVDGGLLDACRGFAVMAADGINWPVFCWPGLVRGFSPPKPGQWRGGRNMTIREGWAECYTAEQKEMARV